MKTNSKCIACAIGGCIVTTLIIINFIAAGITFDIKDEKGYEIWFWISISLGFLLVFVVSMLSFLYYIVNDYKSFRSERETTV